MDNELPPELIAELDSVGETLVVTHAPLRSTDGETEYPAYLNPEGRCFVVQDFDMATLQWLESVFVHIETCSTCYVRFSHYAVAMVMGVVASARSVYPSWGFPQDQPLLAVVSMREAEEDGLITLGDYFEQMQNRVEEEGGDSAH